MAANSAIEWTDQTWNPVVGCTKVSPGCAHCYAETMAARLKAMALKDIADGKPADRKRHYIEAIDDKGRWSGKLVTVPEALDDPDGWRKPRQVFVNSMSDLFHEDIPDEFIALVWQTMRRSVKHTFQVLTKRADRMYQVLSKWRPCEHGWITHNGENPKGYGGGGIIVGDTPTRKLDGSGMDDGRWPLPNVWLGVSAERQQEADERIPWLLKTPAAVRFVSAEPLLGEINLGFTRRPTDDDYRGWHEDGPIDVVITKRAQQLHWIIVGGESGHGARPCNVAWIRSIIQQCQAAGVACFVKQLGSLPSAPNDEVADWFDACGHLQQQPTASLQGEVGRIFGFRDRKGGDPAEWPADLRVRQMPTTEAATA